MTEENYGQTCSRKVLFTDNFDGKIKKKINYFLDFMW